MASGSSRRASRACEVGSIRRHARVGVPVRPHRHGLGPVESPLARPAPDHLHAVGKKGAPALLHARLPDDVEEDTERAARGPPVQAGDLGVPEPVRVVDQPVGDEPLLGHAQVRARQRVVVGVLVGLAGRPLPEDPDVRGRPGLRPLQDGLDHGLPPVVDHQVLPHLVRAADVEGRLRRRQAGAGEKRLVPLPVADEERSALGIPGLRLVDERQDDVRLEPRTVGGGGQLVGPHLLHGLEQPLGRYGAPGRGRRGARGRGRRAARGRAGRRETRRR